MTEETEPDHAQLIRNGLERARDRGVVLGRPRSGRDDEIRTLLEAGWGQRQVMRHLRVGYWTMRRIAEQIKDEAGCKN